MPQPDPAIIRQVPLFSELDKRELERVAQAFKERQYRAGQNDQRKEKAELIDIN